MNVRQTGILLLLMATGYACTGPVAVLYPPRAHEPVRLVYLVSHGWHTGMVVKRQDIPLDVWPESRDFPDADYLEVGWGEWDYYQAREHSAGGALKAACWPTGSVLHVVGFREPVAGYFPHSDIIALELSPRGFERLCDYTPISTKRNAATLWDKVSQFLFEKLQDLATNLRRGNPTLGALASSPASGHRRQSTAGKMPALPGNPLCGQPTKRPG